MALTRSERMARIGSRDTGPEWALRRALWRRDHRYRLQWDTGRGRADIAFPGRRVAVFVDGCFWHGCPAHYRLPRSNVDFWETKLRANVTRDRRQTRWLERDGWTVVRVWECRIKRSVADAVASVEAALAGEYRPSRPAWRVIGTEAAGDGTSYRMVGLRRNAEATEVRSERRQQSSR